MKLATLSRACFAILAASALFVLFTPDVAQAAMGSAAAAVSHGSHFGLYDVTALVLATGLDNLRAQHADFVRQAAAKIAEVKEGLTPEAVRKIETDHAAILADVSSVAQAIASEEKRKLPAGVEAPENAAVVAAERQRAAAIIALSARHNMPAEFAPAQIAGGASLETVRTLVLDDVAKRAEKNRINPRASITQDEGDMIRAAVSAAIELRVRPSAIPTNTTEGRALIESARAWRGMTLLEMGRVYAEETLGERVRGLGKRELAGFVLGMPINMPRRAAGGSMSTSDFPNILANVVTRRLRDAYTAAPQSWKLISRQSNNPDFKQKSVVQLSNLPKFKEVKEGGEYQYASLSDGAAKYALATYGNLVAITRQTLINDDLGAFDRLPTLQGRAAAETEANIFWALLTANSGVGVTMEDSIALFDNAGHGNYTSSGTAISVASLDVGRAAMRVQKGFGKDADPLNLAPKFLIVSPAKETVAQQFIASITAAKSGDVNPFANSLIQITEARLSGNPWYLVADPATIDTIEYAYLEGEEGLYTETRMGFEVDGIEVKSRLDYAAHVIDYRGFYKNAGA